MTEQQVRTYTVGRPPRKTGLGGISMKVTFMLGGTFFPMMLLIAANQMTLAVIFGIIGGVLTALVHFQIGTRSVASRMQLARQISKRRAAGENLYVAGQDSRIPGGRFRLPGALARTELRESVDMMGRNYAVAIDRPNNRATVFFNATLSGDVDHTRAERDAQTADWGRFEALLSVSGDISSCVVVVSNRPATGQLAAREVMAHMDADAPELARRVQMESASMLSDSSGETTCHIAISFRFPAAQMRDDAFLNALDYKLDDFPKALRWAGIEAELMNYEQVVARAHSFYDPSTESLFEQLAVEGQPHGVAWEDAGPGYALVQQDRYAHENCESVTWEMVEAPASTFEDFVLRPLAQPNPNIPRGRMCMIYTPIPSGRGTKLVEEEYKDALVGMNSSKAVKKIGSTVRAEETDQARRAVARGAAIGWRSLMFTATCGPDEDLQKARTAVEQAAAQASIRLREYTWMHDAGFALTCGMGQTPDIQNTTTKLLR